MNKFLGLLALLSRKMILENILLRDRLCLNKIAFLSGIGRMMKNQDTILRQPALHINLFQFCLFPKK